jgi:hypothetical protein
MDLIMEQFELDMDILHSKYERVNEDLEFLIRKCDMKYIAESGTEDDLTALYTEANEQANEKKKNIFQKILEKIKTFIQKIISKIKGKKDKIEDDKEYEIEDLTKQLEESKRLNAELKSAISSNNSERIKKSSANIKKRILGLGLIAGSAAVIIHTNNVKGKIIKETIDKVNASTVEKEAMIDNLKRRMFESTTMDELEDAVYALRKLTEVDMDLVQRLTRTIQIKQQLDEDIKNHRNNINRKEKRMADEKQAAAMKAEKKIKDAFIDSSALRSEIVSIQSILSDIDDIPYNPPSGKEDIVNKLPTGDVKVYRSIQSSCKKTGTDCIAFINKCMGVSDEENNMVSFIKKNLPKTDYSAINAIDYFERTVRRVGMTPRSKLNVIKGLLEEMYNDEGLNVKHTIDVTDVDQYCTGIRLKLTRIYNCLKVIHDDDRPMAE